MIIICPGTINRNHALNNLCKKIHDPANPSFPPGAAAYWITATVQRRSGTEKQLVRAVRAWPPSHWGSGLLRATLVSLGTFSEYSCLGSQWLH